MVDEQTLNAQQNATFSREKPIWESAFLKILRREGNVTAACRSAKIERSTAYRHRDADPDFKALWAEALEEAADRLEKEAWRRATKGTIKGIYYEGVRVATERQYSDTLLLALLKANRPEKFKERTDITSGNEKLAGPTIVFLPEVRPDEP